MSVVWREEMGATKSEKMFTKYPRVNLFHSNVSA